MLLLNWQGIFSVRGFRARQLPKEWELSLFFSGGGHMVKNISESILDMSDLITVSCPECCKGLFTFSRNILENKGGIQDKIL